MKQTEEHFVKPLNDEELGWLMQICNRKFEQGKFQTIKDILDAVNEWDNNAKQELQDDMIKGYRMCIRDIIKMIQALQKQRSKIE